MSTTTLYLSIIFGSIGGGLFIFGLRQKSILHLAVGAALSVLPFFITNWIAMTLVGIVLTILPFVLSIG